ncbi:MAG: phosphonate ABC transporter, permease protein PhnE [Bacteroidales bacterium]|nr:phosphonate ABC transporter, permease protein PhnE [Bacteroidales bacterium]
MKKEKSKEQTFFQKVKFVAKDIFSPYFSKEARTFKTKEFEVVQPYPMSMYILIVLVIVFILAIRATNIDLIMFFGNLDNMWRIISRLIDPNFAFLPRMYDSLIETIQLSVGGTLIGSILAIPAAIFSSSNIVKKSVIYNPVRFIMSLIRTIPVLVYAAMLMFIIGMGAMAGLIALAIFTFTIVAKMLYEVIETVNMQPYEAIESTGANKLQAIRTAIVPQVLGSYLSIVLYNFEINIRSAAIIGFVGAGGIGLLLNDRISWRQYEDVGMILLVLFAVIILIESLSRYLRKKLT